MFVKDVVDINGKEVIDYITGMSGKGVKIGLQNMRELLPELGNPQNDFKSVHIAGTNGKGSVCAYMDSILREAGMSVGLYTSPYIQVYNERVRVNGEPINDEALGLCGTRLKEIVDSLISRGVRPTFFELGTALAFQYFAERKVDMAVVETGIGGRLDVTNIIDPVLTIITRIGYDHMAILGDTLEKIAFEKAGIIKPGVPCVLYPQAPEVEKVFEDACAERGAQLIKLNPGDVRILNADTKGVTFKLGNLGEEEDELEVCLPGEHQAYNAACAYLAARRLGISKAVIKRGLYNTRWAGRLEWFGRFLLDGAHNEQAAAALVDFVKKNFQELGHILMIVGIMADKPYERIAQCFSEIADEVITVEANTHRALGAGELARVFEKKGVCASPAASVREAIERARERGGDTVIISGSLYLVGEARTILQENL